MRSWMFFSVCTVCLTSTSLLLTLMCLNPGMRFCVQTTPTSSECLQSETPNPFELQSEIDASLPVQCTLSNKIGPTHKHTHIRTQSERDLLSRQADKNNKDTRSPYPHTVCLSVHDVVLHGIINDFPEIRNRQTDEQRDSGDVVSPLSRFLTEETLTHGMLLRGTSLYYI